MRIAIIGGIGSGKSTVLGILRELGYVALSADEINSELLSSADYIKKLSGLFPFAVKDGSVDRHALAEVVFKDKEALKKLNTLAHPLILQRIEDVKADILFAEMPLYLESGAERMFDFCALVSSPLGLRIERLKGRGLGEEEARRRILAQRSEDELKAAADYVIDNSGSVENLRAQTLAMLAEFGIIKREKQF